LQDIEAINLPIKQTPYADNIYWVFAITLKDNYKKDAQQVMKELGAKGIGTRPFFIRCTNSLSLKKWVYLKMRNIQMQPNCMNEVFIFQVA
jgi:dTDP-4-amino-4,6-dideoxygalactose transaminase